MQDHMRPEFLKQAPPHHIFFDLLPVWVNGMLAIPAHCRRIFGFFYATYGLRVRLVADEKLGCLKKMFNRWIVQAIYLHTVSGKIGKKAPLFSGQVKIDRHKTPKRTIDDKQRGLTAPKKGDLLLRMMTADEIIGHILSDPRVFLHYTSEAGLQGILAEGVIRTNVRGAVYFTQEPFSQAQVHTNLMIGATTHEGRGTHLLAVRLDNGIPIETCGYMEVCVRQTIRLSQHQILYSGPNPF